MGYGAKSNKKIAAIFDLRFAFSKRNPAAAVLSSSPEAALDVGSSEPSIA